MKKNNLSSRIYHLGSNPSFTLMEILIVTTLIALIAVVALVLFNPMQQIGKAYDAKRKHELTDLRKAMEDYYNDKGCYPKPSEICYDLPPTNIFGSGVGNGRPLESQTCHICGNESSSPSFSPYLSSLPCDPQHKQKQYLYEVVAAITIPPITFGTLPLDPDDAINPCPQWYRVYSDLSIQSDSSIVELGCQASGCGIVPIYGYDYGVTSPNEKLKKTSSYTCYTGSKTCDSCGRYENCNNPSSGCIIIYSSRVNCCLAHQYPGC